LKVPGGGGGGGTGVQRVVRRRMGGGGEAVYMQTVTFTFTSPPLVKKTFLAECVAVLGHHTAFITITQTL
jgi:hypothetical protein